MLHPPRHLVEQGVRVAGQVPHRDQGRADSAVLADRAQPAVGEDAVGQVHTGTGQPLDVRQAAERLEHQVGLEGRPVVQQHPADPGLVDGRGPVDGGLERHRTAAQPEADPVLLVPTPQRGADLHPQRSLHRYLFRRNDIHLTAQAPRGRSDLAADEPGAEHHEPPSRAHRAWRPAASSTVRSTCRPAVGPGRSSLRGRSPLAATRPSA